MDSVNKHISAPAGAPCSDQHGPEPLRPGRAVVGDARAWWGAAFVVAAVGWGANQFAPLLLMYRAGLGLSTATVEATFGMYAIGLIPGLLIGGPVSDRYGRRRVMVPALVASVAGTILLIFGGSGVEWLFAGRLIAGVASGAAFSSGAAWIKELSTAGSSGGGNPGPRRVTVAMTVGFGVGPLVAGVLAQWAPAPTVLPYLPHLALAVVAFPLMRRSPETRSANRQNSLRQQLRMPEVRGRRFRTVVVPLAPWVFGSASIAFAYLPGLVEKNLGGYALVFSAMVTLLTAAAGILVQPLARRIDHPGRPRLIGTALAIVVAGLLIAAAAAATSQPMLVVAAALVLGAGYGCCQVCGLLEVQRLAQPDDLAGLTAAYQAVSYLGFAAPFLLAAVDHAVPASELLIAVAVLAALTLVWTTRKATLPHQGVGQPDEVALAAGRADDESAPAPDSAAS
ncbi:MAG: MFS transporter [Actinomycetota bacterium]|nr:MFS transporter [Actinomycetota bacterium]